MIRLHIVLLCILNIFYNKMEAQCVPASQPVLNYYVDTISSCVYGNAFVYISSGSLNNDTTWHWYFNSCNGQSLGFGDTIQYQIGTNNNTFYVRGEGPCTTLAPCTSIIVHGLDTAKPVPLIDPLPPIKGQCYAGAFNSQLWPQAIDNCQGLILSGALNSVQRWTQGIDTINWYFVDQANNYSYQDQLLIVDDTIPPIPLINVLPPIYTQCDTILSLFPYSIDNCAATSPLPGPGPLSSFTNDPLVYTQQGYDTIEWIYDDGHGNVVSQYQEIIVQDTIGPVLICPQTTTVIASSGQNSAIVNGISPMASDNCVGGISYIFSLSGATSGNYSGDASGHSFNVGFTNLTYSAKDALNNSSTCTALIQVLSTTGIPSLNGNSIDGFHPQPNSGLVTLSLSRNVNEHIELKVYDQRGKLISSQSFLNKGINHLDYSQLKSGIYIMHVSGRKLESSFKMIKE